jgi:hypothetical protein
MSYYVEQDDLGTVKAWFEENRRLRREEAARLEQRLEEVNAELDEFEDRLEEHREREAKLMFHRMDLTPTPMEEGIERYSRSLRQRKWDFTRQLRDLVRWDRDDLEWIGTLERKEREANRQYRSANDTRQRERAETWRAKKEATDE